MSEEEKKYLTEDEMQTYENYCNGFTNSAYDDTLEHLIEARKKIEQLEKENKELKDWKSEQGCSIQEVYELFIPKSVIREKINERQFELQQEYKDFKDDIRLNTLQEIYYGEEK